MGSLKNKKVLVTGGKGYLGSRLIKYLEKEKAEVYIISLEPSVNSNEYQLDINNAEQVKAIINKIQPEIIFHLAAIIDRNRDFTNYEKITAVNVNGTLNLLQALKDIDYENFIFTSSSEVYGNNPSPYNEKLPPLPASPYSLSKVYAEQLIQTFCQTYNKNYTILRLFNFYGENMPENFFIPQIIQTLKRNENFSMTSGEQLRDFLYIEDIIQGLSLAATEKEAIGEIFNVCSGTGTSLKKLAEEIETMIDSQGEILYGNIPYRNNEIWEMIGDNTKIKNILGFIPQYTLKNGIEKCLAN